MSAAHAAGASEPTLDAFIALAQRLRWDEVLPATRTMVKRELLDWGGAAIAGRAAAGMPPWLQVLVDCGGRADARVLGGPRVPAHTAALCNGYFGHVLELDDTHDEAVLHAGSAAIPAALAAAGLKGRVTGADFCLAVLLGIELTCRLGVATRLNLVEGGWIYTALFGHFGAALAAARVIDHRPDVLRNAFGIVYCLASGNHQSTREGAPTKHVQPGFAASNAILATLMARGGLDGVKQPLTGEDGLSRVYLHGRFDAARAIQDLGTRYEIDRLSFKPYPTCRLTHPAISAALELRAKLGHDIANIDRIELVIGPQAHDVVGRDVPERRTPVTRVAAQFSVYWTVAVALAYGEVTPRQLAEDIPPSAHVRAWIDRISCRADAAAGQRDVGGCTIRAHGSFGTLEVTHTNAKGHPDDPLSEEELAAKFHANARYAGMSATDASALAGKIMRLDSMDDVVPFLDTLGTAAPYAANRPV
ncbi:MAG TPA: MmgE/PrpD family protein [Burkholderiales bacterium]|nr:MmgE/PrpD family protein [Burkholderiales bacterium]